MPADARRAHHLVVNGHSGILLARGHILSRRTYSVFYPVTQKISHTYPTQKHARELKPRKRLVHGGPHLQNGPCTASSVTGTFQYKGNRLNGPAHVSQFVGELDFHEIAYFVSSQSPLHPSILVLDLTELKSGYSLALDLGGTTRCN